MPNWCCNYMVVTGPIEEIARLKQTCIRRDEEGEAYFYFNSLIPMPAIIKSTIVTPEDALVAMGPDDSIPRSLIQRMEYSNLTDVAELKEKIGRESLEKAGQSIEGFEQAGAPNWYVWSNMNWGTKWNACDFKVIRDEPGRYECRFETAWYPPEPVYAKLAEMFPNLCLEIDGWDDQRNFDFEATARDGAFSIRYDDPYRKGFQTGINSDSLLDEAKTCGNDPKRWLCVGLCRAVIFNHRDSENDECVVAWARGDTKEDSENSCRDVIARNHRLIKTVITDWQFTVYAPGEIRPKADAKLEPLSVLPVTDDDLPF